MHSRLAEGWVCLQICQQRQQLHKHHETKYDTEVFKLMELNELKGSIKRIFTAAKRQLRRGDAGKFVMRLNMCKRYQGVVDRPMDRRPERWQQIVARMGTQRNQPGF